jgi:hypothetical protein
LQGGGLEHQFDLHGLIEGEFREVLAIDAFAQQSFQLVFLTDGGCQLCIGRLQFLDLLPEAGVFGLELLLGVPARRWKK